MMDDPTIDFNLITFQEMQAASYSTASISRALLRDRILLARTQLGNYAKFQVKSGDNLLISRLTVYSPSGCIVQLATNLVIHSSFCCDLDHARESSIAGGADFWWHGISAGVYFLEPQNGATFHLYKGFDDVTFNDVRTAPFIPQRIGRVALRDQVLYCKTSQGSFAKLLVEAGDTLIVRRLTVYRADGSVSLDRSNIQVPRTWTLDLDTGNVGAGGYDLWWEAETETSFFLVPTNGAVFSYPSYYRFEKYQSLLCNSAIRAAMTFVDARGTRSYNAWSEGEKLQLNEYLYACEMGIKLPISGPPALTSDRYMSGCDAWKIYLAHVAQVLWVEANHRVAWHISSVGADYLAHLFDMRTLLMFTPGQGHSFDFGTMGAVTDWSPSISYTFLVTNHLVKTDAWKTIQAVADWCRANLRHITAYFADPDGGPFASQEDQYQYIYGYRGLPLVDKMISPLPGRYHTTHGCWGTDGFLAAVLRTVNIPVRHSRTTFSSALHSRPEFFSVGRNLAHGDDPYNGWIRLGINNVPIERIFYTDAEIRNLIDAPPALPGKTVSETASYNAEKRDIALAVEFKTNYLLHMRCADIASGKVGTSSQVWDALHEYYTDAQIQIIQADCDTAIAAIPGGCSVIKAV